MRLAKSQERLLSADVTVGATATVTVTCTNTGNADGAADVELAAVAAVCGDSLGTLAHGVAVARSGTIAARAGCTSAGRGQPGTFWARRHTFALDAAARVSVDISADPADGEGPLDAYAVLYRGDSGAAAAVLRGDDNSGPGRDSRLRGVRLAAGTYTIEATTAEAWAAGGYRAAVRALYVSPVRVSGLADAAEAGAGAVTVTDGFAVSPTSADCDAAPSAATTGGSGRRRTVSAKLDTPGALAVTVTCSAAGRGTAQGTAVFTHAGALTSIAARVVGGGGNCTKTSPPRRVDAAYRCTVGRANTVTVAADAAATGPTLATSWKATGRVALAAGAQRAAVPLFAPDNTVAGWQRTATAQIECTGRGTATATAALPGTAAKMTARLTVTCADAVQIAGLDDTTAHGTGTLPVTRNFTVTPATADCTADPNTATVTAGTGAQRTLTAQIAVPGSLEVTVTCEAVGYADGVRTVTLAAARPCTTHLGTLATGTVTRTGVIGRGCEAKARRTRVEDSVFYARKDPHWGRRHTFTLDTPGWVTISINNATTNAKAIDTGLPPESGRHSLSPDSPVGLV